MNELYRSPEISEQVFSPLSNKMNLSTKEGKMVRNQELDRRRNIFIANGFSIKTIDQVQSWRPTLPVADGLVEHLEWLGNIGFSSPKKLIEKNVTILGLTQERINERMVFLKNTGFEKPLRMIEKHPQLFTANQDNLEQTIQFFANKGINSLKLLETHPPLFGLKEETVDKKFEELQRLGFTNIPTLVSTFPPILGLSLDTLSGRISELKKRGFSDPVSLIESFPPLFGYSFENIDKRINFLNKVINIYEIPLSASNIMEMDGFMFSSKLDKLVVLTRIIKEYKVKPQEINKKLISQILRRNLEDMLIALARKENADENIHTLILRARDVNLLKYSVEEKKTIIEQELTKFEKIKQRYYRGYPSKN